MPKREIRTTPDGLDLHDIAEEFGISRARVQQIILKALKKLRKECNRRGLRLEDLLPDARRDVDEAYMSDEDELL